MTGLQALLLRTVILPAADAVAAWEAWRAETDLDALEPDSQWLLPLLYVQLRAAGVPVSGTERYANVYRHNWYKNQLRLRGAGSDGVLVGGAAFAVAYAPALGARPFDRVQWCTQPLHTIEVRHTGRVVRVPGPVDAVVLACAGVGRADDPSSLLWIADAAQAGARLDASGWASVHGRADELGLAEQVAEGLALLERTLS